MTEGFCRVAAGAMAVLAVAGFFLSALGADWPTYRHDAGRSGCTPEGLDHPLHRQWTYVPRHPPRPAWPEPVREVHLMPFDYAYQVVAADGLVYFGSSADHKVYALDLATGRERWSFFTDAPVRFAPSVYQRKLYVASDDGWVYCLSVAEGKLIWRRRGGPRDERLLGNENMISRWPLRSGLVVEGGTVYLTAGMWPSEGVYVYALSAEDGSVLWKTEDTGDFAPQGYMAAGQKLLVAPAGRSSTWIIDRATGKARIYKGMSQAIIKGDLFFSGPFTHKANENLPIKGGVALSRRSRKITAWDLRSDGPPWDFAGKDSAAVGDEAVYLAGEGKIAAYPLRDMERKWQVDYARVFSLAIAGEALVVGGDDDVALLEASTGRTLWSANVEGEARGLAVADGRLLVSTHQGRIVCFGPERPATAAIVAPVSESPASRPDRAALAEQIIKNTGITAGYCLLLGAGDGRLAVELARQSELRIYCAEPDEEKVAAVRRFVSAAGLYGARVTVHHIEPKILPYPDYFADLIVVDQQSAGPLHYSPGELYRVLRPYGGTVYWAFAAGTAGESKDRPRLGMPGDELTETRVSPTAVKLVRGELPGAGQWTHQYADAGKSGSSGDRRVRWPLKILWFGKPGPGRMMNRHWRGTAPVCTDGRMFILGQHSVIAVDAYNGRELWSREMPSVARRVVDIRGGSMVADAESVYVAVSDMCLRLDARTGQPRRVYRLPLVRPRFALSSPQTIRLGELGKVEIRKAPEALELELTTFDATVVNSDRLNNPTRGDSWELFFDFRAPARRTGLYGPGAFQAIVVPATAERGPSWRSGIWSSAPELDVAGRLGEDGSRTTVRVPWAEIEKLAGREVADFNFGLILNSSDDGRSLVKRTYKFANDASYRLANCWGRLVTGAGGPGEEAAGQAGLLTSEQAERLTWGNLILSGDLILGTTVATKDSPSVLRWGRDLSSEDHDYTGPPVAEVLGNIGADDGARHVFALDKNDGRLRWTYAAAGEVPHNGIAVWQNRVYLLDRPNPAEAERLKRRGELVAERPSLEVLDLATGKRLWRLDEGLESHIGLRLGKGILLATHLNGLSAYDAGDGRRLWSLDTSQPMHHCSAFLRAPVIAGNWVYDEPHAYALRTGKPRIDAGNGAPWQWGGFRGCGTVSAAENMLFFRTGVPALLDVGGGSGLHEFPAIRPGCYINVIAAGGLVLMPEASSGCGCPYNFQTTVVLAPE